MGEQVPITEAGARLESLVRQACHCRDRVTITDHGEPAAVLINPQELADLDEAVALANFRAQQAAGTARTVPHDEVRARLGLPRE
jgi:prevent-host-death family protein